MKAFRSILLSTLLLTATTLFLYLGCSSNKGTTTPNPDTVVSIGSRKLLAMKSTMKRRKLIKGKIESTREDHGDNITRGDMSLEDYYNGPGLTDPVPSSSTNSVKPGPIQHGTPLMPYIPKPSPPPTPTIQADQFP